MTESKPGNWFTLKILVAVLLGWILIQLWITAIDVFFYVYCGLSNTSAYHTTLVALLFTTIFIMFLFLSGDTSDTIKSNLTGIIPGTVSVPENVVSPLMAT
jgi:hypothetical protein